MTTTTALPPLSPPPSSPYAHHVGGFPPTSFTNPWPSFDPSPQRPISLLRVRFGSQRPPFVPVPGREELVPIRKPTWGLDADKAKDGMKVTWLGHASFLVETACAPGRERGLRILLDPVFSERTSPVQWLGPRRYSPLPCKWEEVPEADVVVVSHDHYDHLDAATVAWLNKRGGDGAKGVSFFCGLGLKRWFEGVGVNADRVKELDWWDGVEVNVDGIGGVRLWCTPSQHISGRGVWDRGRALWCSWVVEEVVQEGRSESSDHIVAHELSVGEGVSVTAKERAKGINEVQKNQRTRKLYFAGDTGYRSVTTQDLSLEEEEKLPHCPAFAEIGERFGPFDISLLPIGLCSPRYFMSPVHCNPSDSICIHQDIKSKRSIGMHWGTVRGGLSQEYEDVRHPPRWWKEAAERKGLRWGQDIALMDIGETITIE